MGVLTSKNKKPFDKVWLGFALGLLVPIGAFFLYYYLKFSDVELKSYLSSLHQYRLMFKVLSLCVLTDLPLFYGFLQFKNMRTARGVVMACFIFAFAVLIYRAFN